MIVKKKVAKEASINDELNLWTIALETAVINLSNKPLTQDLVDDFNKQIQKHKEAKQNKVAKGVQSYIKNSGIPK